MLTKTIVAGGMLIAATAGGIITSIPASAQTPTYGSDCCSSSHSRWFSAHRNRNWNGSENEGLNRIRLRIHNRNNNIAVARTPREERRGVGAPLIGAPGVG